MYAKRLVLAISLISLCASAACAAETGGLAVEPSVNSRTIPPYEVFEISFRHEAACKDPFFDVTIDVALTSPGGKAFKVGGFHYGSSEKPLIKKQEVPAAKGTRLSVEYVFSKHDLWKARFAPGELGKWTYA